MSNMFINTFFKVVKLMDMNEILALNIETYFDEKMNLMVGLCEQMGLPAVFNKNLEKSLGRKTDIPY